MWRKVSPPSLAGPHPPTLHFLFDRVSLQCVYVMLGEIMCVLIGFTLELLLSESDHPCSLLTV